MIDVTKKAIKKSKETDSNIFIYMILFPLLLFILIFPVVDGYEEVYSLRPSIQDSWSETFNYVDSNTNPNSLIASWWDYGYPIEAFANRRVLFDGGSQESPTAYWMAKALSTSNQNLSAGIIKMLSCSKDPYLNKLRLLLEDSTELFEKLIILNPKEAIKILDYDQDKNKEIIEELFCQSKDNYLALSTEMLGFNQIFKLGVDEVLDQTGFSPLIKCNSADNFTFYCNNVMVVKDEDKVLNVTVTQKNGRLNPSLIITNFNGKISKKEFSNAQFPGEVYFFNEGDSYYALMASSNLLESAFFKLLFLEGEIHYFEKVYQTGSIETSKVVLYKVK